MITYLSHKDTQKIIKNAKKAYEDFKVRPDLYPEKQTPISEFKKIDVLEEIQKNMKDKPEKFYNKVGNYQKITLKVTVFSILFKMLERLKISWKTVQQL